MERRKTFFNQTFKCPNCNRVYQEQNNFCPDCGKSMSIAGDALEEIKEKNIKLEFVLKLINIVDDKATLEKLKRVINDLKK